MISCPGFLDILEDVLNNLGCTSMSGTLGGDVFGREINSGPKSHVNVPLSLNSLICSVHLSKITPQMKVL